MSKKLPENIALPLKVVSVRANHLKIKFPGIIKSIETKALKNLSLRKATNSSDLLLTWNDWINTAGQIFLKIEAENAKKQNEENKLPDILDRIVKNQSSKNPLNYPVSLDYGDSQNKDVYQNALKLISDKIKKPTYSQTDEESIDFLDRLSNTTGITIGELVTLGNWLLTKNIYRFEDIVINEVLKTGFEGNLPNYIVNLPEISTYIQTDNADLYFENKKVVGIVFCKTELDDNLVLVSTLYLDDGLPRTIAMNLEEDQNIESCVTDFINDFQSQILEEPDEKIINERISIQKKIINLVLWFSQTEPDYYPLTPLTSDEKITFKNINGEKRLFEASKYRTYIVGKKTGELFNKVYSELERTLQKETGINKRAPHLRKSHWHLYWYGKKGKFEKYDFKLLPITIVGGSK